MNIIKNYGKPLSTIFMSTGMMSTFIILFYFLYSAKIENALVQNEISRLADRITNYMTVLNENILTNINNVVDQTLLEIDTNPQIIQADQTVATKNKKLMTTALCICVPLALLCFTISFYIWKSSDFSIKEVIFENFITLFAVFIVELLFTKYIIGQFMPLDINNLRVNVINDLDQN